jgi:methylthioxylose transferase
MLLATWLLIGVVTLASLAMLWLTALPLGVPGEWVWDRVAAEPDSLISGLGAAVAAALYIAVVRAVWIRLRSVKHRTITGREQWCWLSCLVVMSFVWLWVVQEAAPPKNRLGKAAFVLFYPSSSGYFTKARFEEPSPGKLLAGYEELMRQRDVLHVGTHPPGLFLIFHELIDICESPSWVSTFLDATQPVSFQETCDVISRNSVRSKSPRPLMPLDRRVLWFATVLVLLSAALVVVPLYGVVRLTHAPDVAWLTAAIWPAIPAVAAFVPKSDVVYAFIGMMFVWTWLLAVRRRSVVMALVSGSIAWCGLMCSLAFLPVFLFAAIAGCGRKKLGEAEGCHAEGTLAGSRWRALLPPWRCVIAALAAFGGLTLALAVCCQINLPEVWWLNYQNHAGFYAQYTRTYWKWLLVNPPELLLAAGAPLGLLAWMSTVKVVRERGSVLLPVAGSMLFVWGTLWLTGKNSGEAARLWIAFLPWLVWLAGPYLAETEAQSNHRWLRPAWILLSLQFATGLLTVARVSGFHFE